MLGRRGSTKKVTTRDIIERGYFPKELPPPFGAASFARNYSKLPKSSTQTSRSLRFSNSKYASLRRTMSIPNPAHMIVLADLVAKNWKALHAHCNQSVWSRTAPVSGTERAIEGRTSLEDFPHARAIARTGARYVLKADVANFYGSLYTHALPWALHTKAVAKRNRKTTRSSASTSTLFGNELDLASRNIQSGQTVGVPVGPDTSFVLAEAVLCAVDVHAGESIGAKVPGIRFMDDYEFACGSLAEAEYVRATLQDSLAEFELQLNAQKTRIIELPDALDTVWVHELSTFAIDSMEESVKRSQMLRYLSRSFELMRDNPGEPVMKYAVRRLAEGDLKSNPELMQALLLQVAAVDPGTLHTALYAIYKQSQSGIAVDKNAMQLALTAIIHQHAPLQHGDDVSWALWGAIVFGISLDDEVVSSLEKLTDSVAILVALHAEAEGLLSRTLDKATWEAFAVSHELYEPKWLLAYEGVGQGFIGGGKKDPAASDPFFASARAESVSFYDATAAKVIPPPSVAGSYS